MIELLHAIEVIRDLLHDRDLQGDDLVVQGPRREEAVGVIEAPRGTLIHHYRVDGNDAVTMCNLIVSTTHNNEPMNRAVTKVARDHFAGKSEITDGLMNYIEVAVRAYDPCLSCATHALGQMALDVELVDAAGDVVAFRQCVKSGQTLIIRGFRHDNGRWHADPGDWVRESGPGRRWARAGARGATPGVVARRA